ncbi:MAG: alpha/beta hydrolase family protein [Bryobacteraceae bacterium]
MKLALLLLAPVLCLAKPPWDIRALSQPPKVYEAKTEEAGVRALYFESVPWKGKPTRVFAYYGAPAGKNLPAMVLIHGGGGTAFAEWVRMWNKRGYAAIAMDTVGTVPDKAGLLKPWAPPRKRHEFSGPPGWGDFESIDEPATDQWTHHAVAAAILAHSLIRSFPEVDPDRIGVTGISWGGYLTAIVSGIDPRFRFAAPVYGCGFLGEDSAWLKDFAKLGPERAKKWLSLWDPSVYLPSAKMPMLWVTGTNDFAYPLTSLQKSYRLPGGERTLCIRVRMKHNHPDGASPEEIAAFADAIFREGVPLPQIVKSAPGSVEYKSEVRVVKAELNYTKDEGRWQDRKWVSVPAHLDTKIGRDTKAGRAEARVPSGATASYINLFDERGLVVSSEHQ